MLVAMTRTHRYRTRSLACLALAAFGAVAGQTAPPAFVPYAPTLAVVDAFDGSTAFEHQSAAGVSALDRADFVRGDGALRVTTDGDAVQTNVRVVGLDPLDLRDAHVRLALKVDRVDLLDAVVLYLTSDDFASYELYTVARGPGGPDHAVAGSGAWATVTVPLGTPVARGGDGTVDLARVTGWQIGVVDAGAGAVSVWLNGLETVARPPRGVGTVVFDDARDGVARFARPVLDRYGMRASVAVVADLVGTPGFMTLSELRAAARFSGWDVVAHHATLFADDAGFVGLDDAALAAELDAVRAWLVAQGFAAGAAHLAYPSGAFDERTLEVVRTRFASGRTIVRGLGFETWPPADPFRIRALSVADRDGLDELRAAVDRAARERSWLVLVFHQLVDGSAQGPTDFAAEDFAALVAHLAGADVDVRPWSDVLHAR
jgi:hypothetical protein